MVEFSPEREVGESGRELVDSVIKIRETIKSESGERTREVVNREVESSTNREMKERGGK
jgi:hypothetical protein